VEIDHPIVVATDHQGQKLKGGSSTISVDNMLSTRTPNHMVSWDTCPRLLDTTRSSRSSFVLDPHHGVTVNLFPIGAAVTPLSSSSMLAIKDRTPRDKCYNVPSRQSSDGDIEACRAPQRGLSAKTVDNKSHVIVCQANTSRVSGMSLEEDEEAPSVHIMVVSPNTLRDKAKRSHFLEEETSPNSPHPALEFPPLYFVLRRFPTLLDFCQSLYRCRWSISYPLQRRVIFSKVLRKAGIFLTWGEMLLVLPFFAAIAAGAFFSFVQPSVSISGHAARTPLIFCFVTAMRNSFLTLMVGIPFERALWYHKLSARLAYVYGLLHTYVAFVHPSIVQDTGQYPPSTLEGDNANFGKFLVADQVNLGGTMLIVVMTLMMITAMPWIRHRIFEFFYYCHVVFAASMVGCAFFHTGKLVPILAASTWGLDLFIRKVQMACFRNPKTASIRIISDSVIELCFPKTEGFDYNPGQYVYVAVPELSIFEWHPFSLSSSPGQKIVTLHIRKAGGWTSALYALALKKSQINVLMEGPYGSVGVDLMSDRYKMVMLFSGGIGVTPMQAICNQLMYEQSTNQRELKKLAFIWVERDPVVMQEVDVVRRSSAGHFRKVVPEESTNHIIKRSGQQRSTSGVFVPAIDEDCHRPQGIASTILSLVPGSNVTDEQLAEQYPAEEFADLDDDGSNDKSIGNFSLLSRFPFRRTASQATLQAVAVADIDEEGDHADDLDEESLVREAYKHTLSTDGEPKVDENLNALELQVYLTGKHDESKLAGLPFVHFRRPDVKKLFADMREDAISKGEPRVAVCACAPARLVQICRKACVKFSDGKVQFDFHEEVFD
jgi:predicted ferric reductase